MNKASKTVDDSFIPVVNRWKKVLKEATKDSAWYCSGRVVPPTMNVANQLLQYPVNTTGIDLIRSVATVAPFGRGKDTIVDEAVRKGLQIELTAINFLFEASWQKRLDTITAELCKAYNETEVKLAFYKMLLYEEDGHFSAHKDTLRDKSHIASLLISLPVAGGSEGGVLTVKDTASNVELKWDGQCDDLEGSWCSFYTDCIHELSTVIKGKRIVLSYEVHSTAKPTNDIIEKGVDEPVNKIARKGTKEAAEVTPDSLCDVIDSGLAIKDNVLILLDHMYPTGAAKDLKGFDRTLYEVIHNKYGNQGNAFEVKIEEFMLSGDTYGPDEYGDGGENGYEWPGCSLYLEHKEISWLSNSINRSLPSDKQAKKGCEDEVEEEDEDEEEDEYEEDEEYEKLFCKYHCYFNPDNYLCLFHSDDISCRQYYECKYIHHQGNHAAGELSYKLFVIRVSKK